MTSIGKLDMMASLIGCVRPIPSRLRSRESALDRAARARLRADADCDFFVFYELA
jgi:hypothetical protein